MTFRALVVVVVLAAALAPDVAHACAVCFDAKEESRIAFFVTTILLSFLPLGMVGGIVWFIRRESKRRALEDRSPF